MNHVKNFFTACSRAGAFFGGERHGTIHIFALAWQHGNLNGTQNQGGNSLGRGTKRYQKVPKGTKSGYQKVPNSTWYVLVPYGHVTGSPVGTSEPAAPPCQKRVHLFSRRTFVKQGSLAKLKGVWVSIQQSNFAYLKSSGGLLEVPPSNTGCP